MCRKLLTIPVDLVNSSRNVAVSSPAIAFRNATYSIAEPRKRVGFPQKLFDTQCGFRHEWTINRATIIVTDGGVITSTVLWYGCGTLSNLPNWQISRFMWVWYSVTWVVGYFSSSEWHHTTPLFRSFSDLIKVMQEIGCFVLGTSRFFTLIILALMCLFFTLMEH